MPLCGFHSYKKINGLFGIINGFTIIKALLTFIALNKKKPRHETQRG